MKRLLEKMKGLLAGQGRHGESPFAEFNLTRLPGDRGRICHAPFRSMRFEQRGAVRACCYNQQVILGRYPEMNLRQIWDSTEAGTLREKVNSSDLSYGCRLCEEQLENREFSTVKLKQYDRLPGTESDYPTVLDFSVHNTCNLECVMCHGEFSSSIRRNREKLPPVPMPYDAGFVRQLEEFIPHATQFVFAGGEPFLIDLYYDIWERINTLNPTDVHIVTNGTVLNGKVKRILNSGRYHITHSMESFKQGTYEQIRLNADLGQVLRNMDCFMAYCKDTGTEYAINVCPIRQNWEEIPGFVKFCNGHGIRLYILNVVYPPKNTLMVLPGRELQEIEVFYQKQGFGGDSDIERHNASQFNDLLSRVKGWKQKAAEREGRPSADEAGPESEHSLDIGELFALMLKKVEDFREGNPGFDPVTAEQAAQQVRLYASIYEGRRVSRGKLREMENLSADSFIGIINGSSEEEFDLILRDHLLH